MATKVDITRYRGDTDPFVFNLTKDGVPLNLTGNTFIMSVSTQQAPTSPAYVFQLTGVVAAPLSGQVVFTPTELNMDIIDSYFYDVQMTGASIKTIVTGKLKMIQDITK